eukprot:TRINITY_DN4277_c0_g1_i1.p1 TRINITY_DN4277_c0_g1~~TRINITY_DN4277_c0_g1_i1.p1  ORF type:complete len:175 (+),score=41.42 TRINITY_DN4277_c0_g1_i1:50-574(+)
MTSTRRFKATDLLKFNEVNLDPLTENYNLGYYLKYLNTWPDCNYTTEHADGTVMGYIFGKTEGPGKLFHGHVTAVSVAPPYRRIGLACLLMDILEDVTDNVHGGYFVDLFVRKSNDVAIKFYEKLGYVVYRRVIEYYSGKEDAYDMRKSMSIDVNKESMVPLDRPIYPNELEQW